MEKITGIKLTLQQGIEIKEDLQADLSSRTLSRIIGVSDARLLRCSVDARKKHDVHFVATAGIVENEPARSDAPQAIMPLNQRPLPHATDISCGEMRSSDEAAAKSITYEAPARAFSNASAPHLQRRPIVCGMGPAGLFAALELAEAGLRPLVIERGAPVEERQADVTRFRATRVLGTSSNVQFGEGGAGTFSDGKLTCGKNSPLTEQVLRTFVAAGAPLDILWQAKPHIGTDILGNVVKAIRQRIIACGGTVRFHTQLTDVHASHGRLDAIMIESPQGSEEIPCSVLILATGHSARDTIRMLHKAGLFMEPKAFSMGVRIEHLQDAVNHAQFGQAAHHPALGAADYKLNVHLENGRGVYTFCMCPGGEVVAASSENGMLCVNGMSEHARAGRNANSALLCSVTPTDFAQFAAASNAPDPLAGIAFQRHWETQAYRAGGSDWRAPVQTVGSFLANNASTAGTTYGHSAALHHPVEPTYPLGVREADLRSCLPEFVSASLAEALPLLGRKLRGFDSPSAVMTGIEARSSSPVRIVRNRDTLESQGMGGIYPCGEGAGYAGGIMSAAIDGVTVARRIIGH